MGTLGLWNIVTVGFEATTERSAARANPVKRARLSKLNIFSLKAMIRKKRMKALGELSSFYIFNCTMPGRGIEGGNDVCACTQKGEIIRDSQIFESVGP
ncbi:hypothetical protein QG37_02772 [Candidozyma auris]|nr:hypothetical protein QG37_02772 [[Candida] auris]